jgi:hypothetical protein
LVSNTSVNTNDAVNKALSPMAQIIVSKQQTEAAKANAIAQASTAIGNSGNLNELTQRVPQDVLIGLKSLADVFNAVIPKQTEVINDEKKE